MSVLHLLQQFVGTDFLVALYYQGIDFDALSGLHIENHIHTVLLSLGNDGIFLHLGGNSDIGIAFFEIIGTDFVPRRGEKILCHHITRGYLHLIFQLVVVAFLHTANLKHTHLRTAAQLYLEKNLVTLYAGYINLDVLKHTLLPQTVYSGSQLVARYSYLVTNLQASYQQYHSCVEILGTLECYTAYLIRLWCEIVYIVFLIAYNNLGKPRKR